MQKQGIPVGHDMIIQKDQDINFLMNGSTRSVGSVVRVWCDQFINQLRGFTSRSEQSTKQARNEASLASLQGFCCELCKYIIKQVVKEDQLCNMDETGFIKNKNSSKVVVLKGSRKV